MRFHRRGVDQDFHGRPTCLRERVEQVHPNALGGPADIAIVESFPRPVFRREARIMELRKRLEITAAEETLWNAVAQIMRDNAATFRANVPDRSKGPDTSTAVEDLKAFQIIADEHANGLRKLIPAFEALYASMPPAQQKRADQVFRKHERQSDF